jgi:hypothetical protein
MIAHVEKHQNERFVRALGSAAFQGYHSMESFLIEEFSFRWRPIFCTGTVKSHIRKRLMQVHDDLS